MKISCDVIIGLKGRVITHVGDDFIELDNGVQIQFDNNVVEHLNDYFEDDWEFSNKCNVNLKNHEEA